MYYSYILIKSMILNFNFLIIYLNEKKYIYINNFHTFLYMYKILKKYIIINEIYFPLLTLFKSL